MAYRPDTKKPDISEALRWGGDELDDALLDGVTGGTDSTGSTTTTTSNIMKTKHDTVNNTTSNVH